MTTETNITGFQAFQLKQEDQNNSIALFIEKKGNGSASAFHMKSDDKIKLPVKAINLTMDRVRAMVEAEIEIPDWNKFLKIEFISFKNFLTALDNYNIAYKDAYDWMGQQLNPAPVAKEGAEKLASVLISLAANLNGEQLFSELEKLMVEHKEKAINIANNLAFMNKRDTNGWIYASKQTPKHPKIANN